MQMGTDEKLQNNSKYFKMIMWKAQCSTIHSQWNMLTNPTIKFLQNLQV